MPLRRVLPVVAVAVVAVLGLVAAGLGVALRTVWLPDDQVTAVAESDDAAPLAVTAPGLLELRPGPVTVTATAADGGPVLIARGREQDVSAWAESSAHVVLTGLSSPTVLSSETVAAAPQEGAASPAGAEPVPPDPAASDLWVQTETGTGTATMTWDDPPGRWLLLVAGDGTGPAPQTISMTWPREVETPLATPLLATGVVLLVLAAGGAAAIVVHRRRATRRGVQEPAT